MGQLNQRHILVAISGGIAAYKGAELVRLLKKTITNNDVLLPQIASL